MQPVVILSLPALSVYTSAGVHHKATEYATTWTIMFVFHAFDHAACSFTWLWLGLLGLETVYSKI